METFLALKKKLTCPSESAHLGSAKADFQLCHFLKKHFLEKEIKKLIKKISDFLTNGCLQISEENSLREHLFKSLMFNGDEDQESVACGLTEPPGFF
ncbi:Ferritin light chain [Lemmus lemmus]